MKRLEALLTKCKDSIKTNKQKNSALAETNRSLSEQMTEREAECERLRVQVSGSWRMEGARIGPETTQHYRVTLVVSCYADFDLDVMLPARFCVVRCKNWWLTSQIQVNTT